MSKPIAPCKNCSDRYLGCHSECEKYVNFAQENEKHRQERWEANKKRYAACVYVCENIKRNKKKKK